MQGARLTEGTPRLDVLGRLQEWMNIFGGGQFELATMGMQRDAV
jgi:hypothetical protein